MRLWLPPMTELRSDSRIEFEVLDAKRQVRNRGEAAISLLPKGADCELVLDAVDVVLLDVELPNLSGPRLAKALPALVEEKLVADVERCHVVAARTGAGRTAVVAVVDRALLRRALDLFERAGQRVVQATPQSLALPVRPGGWYLRWQEFRGCVRTGTYSGIGLESREVPPLELRLLLSQSLQRPEVLEVRGSVDLTAWSDALGVPVQAARSGGEAPPVIVDLLQGEFSQSIVRWQAWRSCMFLAAVLVLALLGGLNLDAMRLRAEERAIKEAMVDVLRQSFPEVTVVLDPVAQMRQRTADLRAAAGTEHSEFLRISTELGELVGADAVESLEYRAGGFSVVFRNQVLSNERLRTQLTEWAKSHGAELRFNGATALLNRQPSQ